MPRERIRKCICQTRAYTCSIGWRCRAPAAACTSTPTQFTACARARAHAPNIRMCTCRIRGPYAGANATRYDTPRARAPPLSPKIRISHTGPPIRHLQYRMRHMTPRARTSTMTRSSAFSSAPRGTSRCVRAICVTNPHTQVYARQVKNTKRAPPRRHTQVHSRRTRDRARPVAVCAVAPAEPHLQRVQTHAEHVVTRRRGAVAASARGELRLCTMPVIATPMGATIRLCITTMGGAKRADPRTRRPRQTCASRQ